MNTLSAAELKRRGMAAIEDRLRSGPVQLLKRNKPSAVVLTVDDYARLSKGDSGQPSGMTALQWLLNQPKSGSRSKARIDRELRADRNRWK
jgi:PHD/YefM family antitoxin component YafN of YafNO toxin-antitoxin module